MEREIPIVKTYSEAFRLKVISEINSGEITPHGAKRKYGIGGSSTINKWMNRNQEKYISSEIIEVRMKDERSKVEALTTEKKELESALVKTQMKLLAMEALVDIAKDEYGIDLKKKNGNLQSVNLKKIGRRKKSK